MNVLKRLWKRFFNPEPPFEGTALEAQEEINRRRSKALDHEARKKYAEDDGVIYGSGE